LFEHQKRVVQAGGIVHERTQARASCVELVLMVTPGVVNGGTDASGADRRRDRAPSRLALLLHVDPALAPEHQGSH